MKNYNVGDTVKITKKGMFESQTGKIISLSASIDFGALGIWSFNILDIDGINLYETRESRLEATKTTESEPAKSEKVKKVKPTETKPKRAYNRKAK